MSAVDYARLLGSTTLSIHEKINRIKSSEFQNVYIPQKQNRNLEWALGALKRADSTTSNFEIQQLCDFLCNCFTSPDFNRRQIPSIQVATSFLARLEEHQACPKTTLWLLHALVVLDRHCANIVLRPSIDFYLTVLKYGTQCIGNLETSASSILSDDNLDARQISDHLESKLLQLALSHTQPRKLFEQAVTNLKVLVGTKRNALVRELLFHSDILDGYAEVMRHLEDDGSDKFLSYQRLLLQAIQSLPDALARPLLLECFIDASRKASCVKRETQFSFFRFLANGLDDIVILRQLLRIVLRYDLLSSSNDEEHQSQHQFLASLVDRSQFDHECILSLIKIDFSIVEPFLDKLWHTCTLVRPDIMLAFVDAYGNSGRFVEWMKKLARALENKSLSESSSLQAPIVLQALSDSFSRMPTSQRQELLDALTSFVTHVKPGLKRKRKEERESGVLFLEAIFCHRLYAEDLDQLVPDSFRPKKKRTGKQDYIARWCNAHSEEEKLELVHEITKGYLAFDAVVCTLVRCVHFYEIMDIPFFLKNSIQFTQEHFSNEQDRALNLWNQCPAVSMPQSIRNEIIDLLIDYAGSDKLCHYPNILTSIFRNAQRQSLRRFIFDLKSMILPSMLLPVVARYVYELALSV
jgi:hypothetical protein